MTGFIFFENSAFGPDDELSLLPADLGLQVHVLPDSSVIPICLEISHISMPTRTKSMLALSLGTSGLGGWDDHSDADNYLRRMNGLFRALRSAMVHIHQLGKQGTINIMGMGDFGRGLSLNTAYGRDHGNLYNCRDGYLPGKYTSLFIFNADRILFNRNGWNWEQAPVDTRVNR